MLEQQLHTIIAPIVENLGFKLSQIRFGGTGNNSKALQIFAEKPDYTSLSLEDCRSISRAVSEVLDIDETLIKEKYLLEVSSPGIDRSLISSGDFKRFEGFIINLRAKIKVEEVRRFIGRYKVSVNESGTEGVLINSEEHKREFFIEYDNIDSAKIVVNDELFKSKGLSN